jgi:hypothetical protein
MTWLVTDCGATPLTATYYATAILSGTQYTGPSQVAVFGAQPTNILIFTWPDLKYTDLTPGQVITMVIGLQVGLFT